MHFDQTLDAKGASCPIPMLQAKRALSAMEPGQVLRVIATDPAAEVDFRNFSRQLGHEMVSSAREGDSFVFLLRRKS